MERHADAAHRETHLRAVTPRGRIARGSETAQPFCSARSPHACQETKCLCLNCEFDLTVLHKNVQIRANLECGLSFRSVFLSKKTP